MSSKYLNDSGLAYFWTKIKAYIAGLLGSKADDADVVHKTGNEDVHGYKHFKDWGVFENGFRMHEDKSDEFSKGSNPSNTSYGTIFMVGDGGYSTGGDALANRLLEYNCHINTSGVTYHVLRAYNNTANATDWAEFGIANDHGISYAYCPTPAASSNDTKIATTAWTRTFGDNTYLPLTGGTMTGNLTLTNSAKILLRNTSITRGTAPSANVYPFYIEFRDSADKTLAGLYYTYDTNKVAKSHLMCYQGTTNANAWNSIGIGYDSSGNAFTWAPTPATANNSTQIATTAFVKNQGYITSSGNASGLVETSLGSDYEMAHNDFNNKGIGIWKAGFKANTTSAPRYNDGDFALMKLYNATGTSYAQFLCMSPRRDIIYFGHFWNGTWQKWNEIFCSSQHIRLDEGNMVHRSVDTSALWVCGGTSIDSSSNFYVTGQSDTNAGRFGCVARIGSTYRTLMGTYNGNLTWNGQTIQTSSDARLKTSLSSVPDGVLDAWSGVDWGQFKFLAAIEEKGDSARQHVGLIAQQVLAAFNAQGMDACDYGIACHDVWDDEYYEDTVTGEKTLISEAGETWMIRYTEALCMEAAYQRRENARLKKRIAGLEERLAALELKVS